MKEAVTLRYILKLNHRKKILLLLILISVGVWNVWKPLPPEINKAWGARNTSSLGVTFITDTTYLDSEGKRISDQHIFDEVISMIRDAHSYILIDMFLWNDFIGKDSAAYRVLASELAAELIDKKKENPSMVIQVITDPINISYYGDTSFNFENMEKAGIALTYTYLPALRDSNPIFSTFWRVFVLPIDILHTYIFGTHYTFRLLPNVINAGGEKVTLRSLLTLLNFKANHRKLIVTDTINNGKSNFVSLVTSANPHDGSSRHSNVALKIEGNLAKDLIQSERKIVELSGNSFIEPTIVTSNDINQDVEVELITDSAIKDKVLSLLKGTEEGDSIDLLMFYFADKDIIKELINASKRNVAIRIILDPNKDAFGRKKNGIPNRETADSLIKNSNGNIKIKWCDTHGEQCHGKMLVVSSKDVYSLLLGSANYTRRNIGGYNLETNVLVSGDYSYGAWFDASAYFNDLWSNEFFVFSTSYETYKDESKLKKIISWFMENIGIGTF